MLEKKLRNPFKMIGKVFKYEFKHISKVLVPMYAVLIVLGLVIGLLQTPMGDYTKTIVENQQQIEGMESSNGMFIYDVNGETQMLKNQNTFMKTIVVVLLGFIFGIYSTVVFVITMVVLSRRFSKGMLGEEAYLNLVLPVTMGEHIWGRFFAAISWLIIGFVVNAVSILLSMIRSKALTFFPEMWDKIEDQVFNAVGMTPAGFITLSIISGILFCFTIILLVYVVNALGNLCPGSKTLIKFVSAIVLLIVQSNLAKWILEIVGKMPEPKTALIISICCQIFICAVYMTVTHLIFTKKLNLE